jgi:hypothetical protein
VTGAFDADRFFGGKRQVYQGVQVPFDSLGASIRGTVQDQELVAAKNA